MSENTRLVATKKGRIIGGIAGSICAVIVLGLFLSLPLTVVVIGRHYRDPRHCPIQPRISLFLIVHGSVSIASVLFLMICIVLTVYLASRGSSMSIVLGILTVGVMILLVIFSLIWLIVGSVWVFRVHNRVIHEYDRIHHYYLYTYCNPLLYRFTFVYIIISYMALAFQCCCSRLTAMFRSNE